MRMPLILGWLLVTSTVLPAADPKQLFGIFLNSDLYPQKTPKDALESAIGAIERDRIEYLIAHLLDPTLVADRMQGMTPYFEKIASEQISSTGQGMNLRGAELQTRVRDRAVELNFKAFSALVREKLKDEPANLKEMKLFLSDGVFTDDGTNGKVTHKGFKDKALYFKKVGERWFIENRKEEPVAPPPPAKE